MKIAFKLCFSALLLCGTMKLDAQLITLSAKNVSLKTFLKKIQKQSGYTIFYNENLWNKAVSMSLDLKRASLTDALMECFSKQPKLDYSIIGQTVVVSLKKEPPINSLTISVAPQPLWKVTGLVMNMKGERVGNANIILLRTQRGTVSAADGSFKLEGVRPIDTLKVSFIGYKDQLVCLLGRNVVDVVLQEAENNLDDIVKEAYSNTSQRFSTGNITTVKAADIERQPVMNPLLTLQGRVPGLLITQTNGFASAPVKVDIRGVGNLAQATEPLYIIDGVPLTVLLGTAYGFSQTAFGGTQSVAGGESPLFNINPNDIESISVLTGADATAIYGSRGANGVILITTKKGKIGPTKFDFNVTQGVSVITRYWDMLNTQQYLEMRREALKNDGITPTNLTAPDLLVWDTTRYTDWQRALFGHAGKNTKISVGLSGGDPQTLFRINADYSRMSDITTLSGSTQRMTLGFNLDHNTYDRKFSVSLSANYAFSNVNLIPIGYNVGDAPDAPPIFDKDGSPNWAEWDVNGLLDIYPFAPSLTINSEKTNFLTTNLRFNYRPATGLVLSVNAGYNFAYNETDYLEPISSQNPFKTNTGTASFSSTNNSGWIIEPQLSYHMILWKGNMDIIAGGTFNNTKTSLYSQVGLGYTDDNLIHSINNAAVVQAQDNFALYKYGGLLGIIKYNLMDKYILDLNGRRDGSSRFGPGKQFGNFGSAGAAWIVSEEKWFKKAFPAWVNFFKFKGGIGVLGSDGGVGDYQYLSLWSSTGFGGTRLPTYGGIQPYQPYNPPNQDFHWASTTNIDAGLEAGLFEGNRIYLQLRYYMNRTSDQLTTNPLPLFTGFSSLYRNLPATIQNTGWEAMINADILKSSKFSWSAHFNISANRNKLVSFPGLDNSAYARSVVIGMPINSKFLLHYIGVDPATGQYAFEDHNHDGVITGGGFAPDPKAPDDGYIVKNLDPKYFGGFGTMVSYKNLAVSLDFYYKKQIGRNAYSGDYGVMNKNAPVEVYNNRWRQPGDNAVYPAFTSQLSANQSNFVFSDGAYSDASYLRLNNVSIYYGVPESLLKKTGIKDCRFYINAQNVFVITGYKGVDPETQNFGGMPPSRTFTGGITFNF